MKIKLDENLPDDLASLLRADEYDVATVEEEGMAGSDDPRSFRRQRPRTASR